MGNGGVTPQFFTSALDGGEWPELCSVRFKPKERRPVPIGYVGSTDIHDAVVKRNSPGINLQTCNLVTVL
jgi:hypothetical protein